MSFKVDVSSTKTKGFDFVFKSEINMSGGKRKGAGAKKGSKKSIKDGSLVVHAPRMLELAQQFLNSKSKADQKWAMKELLPYVFRKQPQEVTGQGGGPIPIQIIEDVPK